MTALVVILSALAAQGEPGSSVGLALTLEDARARVIASSPGLKASSARLLAADGNLRQADQMINPKVDVEIENFGLDLPTGSRETTLSVTQTIELGGKRQLRVDQARSQQHLAALDRQYARRELLVRTDREFISLLAHQHRLVIAQDSMATASSVADAVRDLVEVGEVSPIHLPRIEAELAMTRAQLSRVEFQLEAAAGRLAALWGGRESPRAAGNLADLLADSITPEGDLQIENLARVKRWTAEAELAETVSLAARRAVIPDLELAAGYRRFAENNESGLVFAAGFNVPLWNRNRGAQDQANALAEAARRDREAELAAVSSQLRSARAELKQAEQEVRIITDEVLPRSQEVFAAVSEGYSFGELPLLEVLDARRALIEARSRLVDAHERQAFTRAEIIRLLPTAASESSETPGETP